MIIRVNRRSFFGAFTALVVAPITAALDWVRCNFVEDDTQVLVDALNKGIQLPAGIYRHTRPLMIQGDRWV